MTPGKPPEALAALKAELERLTAGLPETRPELEALLASMQATEQWLTALANAALDRLATGTEH